VLLTNNYETDYVFSPRLVDCHRTILTIAYFNSSHSVVLLTVPFPLEISQMIRVIVSVGEMAHPSDYLHGCSANKRPAFADNKIFVLVF
jgi:hypothetical protein